MASDYRVGVGHGVALMSLSAITPQPTSGGVRATQRTYGTSGKVHRMGLYAELNWSVIETEANYATLLAQFGLSSALEASVTVYIRNEFYVYTRYNATAVRPELGEDGEWSNYFFRNVTILLKDLVAL